MDWKEENRTRYRRFIDDITDEEAREIAYLAMGKPAQFTVTYVRREINPNNIPHVYIQFTYLHEVVWEEIDDFVGIFDNLNIYHGKSIHTPYCQVELFRALDRMGFLPNNDETQDH